MDLSLLQILFTFVLFPFLVNASPVPHYFRGDVSRRDLSTSQVQQELGPQLSSNALIFGSSDPNFAAATHRWNLIAPPVVEVVVEVAQESDIALVVKYCNQNNLEFLTYNRGHGLTKSLGRFKGVEIDISQLHQVTINAQEQTALIQGGAYMYNVTPALWAEGFETTTGANQCVGLVGPGLGGGHGRLEGLYGLVLDNIIHFNVVLADGCSAGVNATSHPDLFWAMRGAGHNFAIVTSFIIKIYPKKSETWHYHNYYWSPDKLETVFETLNQFQDDGRTPALFGASYLQIFYNASLSADEPVMWLTTSYNGPASDAEEILAPFNAIPTLYEDQGDVPYPDIPGPQGTALDSCASAPYALSTLLLKTYNVTTERQQYELFVKNAALYPELAQSGIRLYYEGYAVAGMRAVPADSTAYPHRDQNHLVFFLAVVPSSNLTSIAEDWAFQHYQMWEAGQPSEETAIYVNYATGSSWETLPAVYGYEPWRLEKLEKVKAEYDPLNKFAWYVPLVSPY